MKIKYLILVILLGFAAGCVSTSDINYQQSEVKTMKRNIKFINLETGEEYINQESKILRRN